MYPPKRRRLNFTQRKNCETSSTNTDTSELLQFLFDGDLLQNLETRLKIYSQVESFKILITAVASGKLDLTNLAWKFILDRSKWAMLDNTMGMSYDNDVLEFCTAMYMMFGAGVVNCLRGIGHFGQVVEQKSQLRHYKPDEAEINFAIPSVRTLQRFSLGYPTTIPCGLITHSLNIAESQSQKERQFVLCYDGKLVAPGVKGEFGDVDLMGCEKPNLTGRINIKERNLSLCNRLLHLNDNMYINVLHARRVMQIISLQIKSLRTQICSNHKNRKRLLALSTKNPDKKMSYARGMSALNENSTACDNIVHSSLQLQYKLCNTIAKCDGRVDVLNEAKLINLSDQSNVHVLLHPDYVSTIMDLSVTGNSQFIKQGTDLWTEKRKEARVTGSTLYRALGLETFAAQKEHFHIHIQKRTPKPFSEELKLKFQYGTRNEQNALATLVGAGVFSIFPPCFAFMEQGIHFVHGGGQEKFLGVSPDGLFQCTQGEGCIHKDRPDHINTALEIKCKFPRDDEPVGPYYNIPLRYSTQCLSEMHVTRTEQLLFVCFTATGVALFFMQNDNELWGKIKLLAEELYGGETPKVPKKSNPQSKLLKAALKNFIETKTRFLYEIPAMQGFYGEGKISKEWLSPYAVTKLDNIGIERDNDELDFEMKICAEEAKSIISDGYQVLRSLAREVMVFMLVDKDRIHDNYVSYAMPIAYVMKGASMSNDQLRFILDKIRNELNKRRISILCECSDGQWLKTCTSSKDGTVLNLLQMSRTTWKSVSSLSKDRCLENIEKLCKMSDVFLENITTTPRMKSEEITVGICKIKRYYESGALYVETIAGEDNPECPILAVCNGKWKQNARIWLYKEKSHEYQRPKQDVGLNTNETSLLDLIDPSLIVDPQISVDQVLDTEFDLGDENIQRMRLQSTLTADEFSLLEDILESLKQINNEKWSDITTSELYPSILTDASKLNKKCIQSEVQAIAGVLKYHTGRSFANSKMTKIEHVNSVVSAFGSNNFIAVPEKRSQSTSRKVYSLKSMARKIIRQNEFPKCVLQSALAELKYMYVHRQWRAKACLPQFANIPDINETGEERVMEYFSLPEYDEQRCQYEPRTVDYTHILTNMRAHILSRGYDFCRKEAFEYIATNHPDVLSMASVKCPMDKQNAFAAMRMFSDYVAFHLYDTAYDKDAEFVELVANWIRACDKRGLSADERVFHLANMHDFLLQDVHFGAFPFKWMGRYIKGMTVHTFEAILQNISTRIQLYEFAKEKTYNSRSVSTLCNESFFFDMARLDKEAYGFPKACNVPKVLGRAVTLNYIKHKACKNYCLLASRKTPYPTHLAERDQIRHATESEHDYVGFYRNNFFDFQDTRKSQRVRKDDISTGLAPLRCMSGVRNYFKTDESEILPEIRAGKDPIAFDATLAVSNDGIYWSAKDF